jgi:hypothetical protein
VADTPDQDAPDTESVADTHDLDAPDTASVADIPAPEDGSQESPLSGAAVEEVVVVESVHTGDQGSADYSGPDAEGNEPPLASTTASNAFASSDFGDLAAEPSDPALAESAVTSDPSPAAGDNAAEWSEIKALFVDDPSASVQRASALVQHALDDFMASLRQRQDALSSWREGDAAGTEDLRVALRGYRGLFDQLEAMSGQLPAQSAGQGPAEAGDGRPVT